MSTPTAVADFLPDLQAIKSQGLFRGLIEVQGPQGPTITVNDRTLLNFCSNDYLGMANDKRLVAAMHKAVDRYGVGSGASPLICGRSEAHQSLERKVAELTGRDRALLFSSGYAANLAVVTALGGGRGGVVIGDRLNHASLVDGAVLSRARIGRFRHGDAGSLTRRLREAGTKKLVLTDSVFSMDGDIAPLPEISKLCKKYNALLVVDDAHGYGVLGDKGGGTLPLHGLGQDDVPVLILTFGKAVGVAGACVAGRSDIIEMLIQKARPYIYSTAPPPALAMTISTSLEIIRAADASRAHLFNLIELFKRRACERCLTIKDSNTPIQPLIAGTGAEAVRISADLLRHGILVTAIRPPTVPVNGSRLRITLTAAHNENQVNKLLEALSQAVKS